MGKRKTKSKDWFVVRSRWGDEFTAQRHLSRQGHEVYLPLMRLPRNRLGVRRVCPLFEGYLFIRQTPQWRHVFSTRGVFDVMRTAETPLRAKDHEIQRIRALEDELGYCSTSPEDWARRGRKPGDHASPRSGPWTGQLGRILEMDGRDRCVLLFSLLGRDVRVNMRTSDLV